MPNRASEKNREIPIPTNEEEALGWILSLLDLDRRTLRNLPQEIVLKGWTAISFLYSGLHPDGALERGTISNDREIYLPITEIEAAGLLFWFRWRKRLTEDLILVSCMKMNSIVVMHRSLE